MSIHLLTRAYSSKKVTRVKIYTSDRVYEGDISDYADGNKGVTTESVHLINATIYTILGQKIEDCKGITILAEAIESFSL